MNPDIKQIFFYVLTLLLGIFIRDIYKWIKIKIFKGEKPLISVHYSCKWLSTSGTTPRNYKFDCVLTIKNIDTVPIYEISVYKKKNKSKIKILKKDSLSPNEKIENKEKIIIQYGDDGNYSDEAKKQLPDDLRSPTIVVEYKNKKGKKFIFEKLFEDK